MPSPRLPRGPVAVTERGVALEGSDATSWLEARGVSVESMGGPLRVFGDLLGSGGLELARVWHNARQVRREVEADGVALTLVVEGQLTISTDDGEVEVLQGAGFVQWSAPRPLVVRSDGHSATLELSFGRSFFERFFIGRDTGVTPIPAGLDSARVLLAAAFTTLATSIDARDDSWPSMRGMLENGICAVLTDLGAGFASASATATRLLRRARAAIAEYSSDPSFDARQLAAVLAVSVSGLYAAFAETERTPSQAIRAARIASARSMLSRRIAPTSIDNDEIAALAGFRSASSMLAAIRATRRGRRE